MTTSVEKKGNKYREKGKLEGLDSTAPKDGESLSDVRQFINGREGEPAAECGCQERAGGQYAHGTMMDG